MPATKARALIERIQDAASLEDLHAINIAADVIKGRAWMKANRPDLEGMIVEAFTEALAAFGGSDDAQGEAA